ncbi:MAG: trypsin-like peptidase domain-containing protein [Bacteroidota bacterium]
MNPRILLICSLFLAISYQTAAQDDYHASPKVRKKPSYLSGIEKESVGLYEKVIPTVVTIYTSTNVLTQQGPSSQESLGSGVLISENNHVLTAAHVVDGSSTIMIKTHDGNLREAELLFSEASADIALLKLVNPAPELKHAKLGDSDVLAIGQRVYAIGSPYGLEDSYSAGIISGFREFNQIYDGTIQVEFIQTDAAINSGNSGGPLFNSQGHVIGIASRILTVSGGFQGIGMVVTINTAKQLLAFEDRPWVGIDGFFLSQQEFSRLLNINIQGGLLVQRVAKGSPADKAGIKGGFIPANILGQEFLLGGDIILEFGPLEACHADCMAEAHHEIVKMDEIKVKFLRGGQVRETVIDVSESRKNFLNN